MDDLTEGVSFSLPSDALFKELAGYKFSHLKHKNILINGHI